LFIKPQDRAWSRDSAPTFEDGKRVTEAAEQYDAAVEEAHAAIGEVVKGIIGEQVASAIDLNALIKRFNARYSESRA
jgi:hypothetical protein